MTCTKVNKWTISLFIYLFNLALSRIPPKHKACSPEGLCKKYKMFCLKVLMTYLHMFTIMGKYEKVKDSS